MPVRPTASRVGRPNACSRAMLSRSTAGSPSSKAASIRASRPHSSAFGSPAAAASSIIRSASGDAGGDVIGTVDGLVPRVQREHDRLRVAAPTRPTREPALLSGPRSTAARATRSWPGPSAQAAALGARSFSRIASSARSHNGMISPLTGPRPRGRPGRTARAGRDRRSCRRLLAAPHRRVHGAAPDTRPSPPRAAGRRARPAAARAGRGPRPAQRRPGRSRAGLLPRPRPLRQACSARSRSASSTMQRSRWPTRSPASRPASIRSAARRCKRSRVRASSSRYPASRTRLVGRRHPRPVHRRPASAGAPPPRPSIASCTSVGSRSASSATASGMPARRAGRRPSTTARAVSGSRRDRCAVMSASRAGTPSGQESGAVVDARPASASELTISATISGLPPDPSWSNGNQVGSRSASRGATSAGVQGATPAVRCPVGIARRDHVCQARHCVLVAEGDGEQHAGRAGTCRDELLGRLVGPVHVFQDDHGPGPIDAPANAARPDRTPPSARAIPLRPDRRRC